MGEGIAAQPAPQANFFRRAGLFLLINPLTQIVVGFVLVGVGITIGQKLGQQLPSVGGVSLTTLTAAATALGTYALFVRIYERRWPTEVGPSSLVRRLITGFGIGTTLFLASVGLIYSCGWSTVAKTAPRTDWPQLIGIALVVQFGVAVFEELLLRGILFRIVERSLGSWLALILSAIVFGLMHIGNPNATLVSALGLSLQAGALLAAAYMVSRSLWLPIGLHWGWNAMQAGVVGGTVSGHTTSAIVTIQPNGPDFLSGGAFGVEGSVIATSLCVMVAFLFGLVAVRRGCTQPGFWSVQAQTKHTVSVATAESGG